VTPYERRSAAIIGSLTFVMVAAVAFSLWIGSRFGSQIAPLFEANSRILLEVETSRLRFEQVLEGTSGPSFTAVRDGLDRAADLTQGMIEGGEVDGLSVSPLSTTRAQTAAQNLLQGLVHLRSLVEARHESFVAGGPDEPSDQEIADAFHFVRTTSGDATGSIRATVDSKLKGFFHLQVALGALIVLSAIFVAAVLFRDDRRRQKTLGLIEEGASALKTSQERLDLALNGAELGLWDWDIASGTVVINERWAEMLGYEFGEVEQTLDYWAALVHPDDITRVKKVLQSHLEGELKTYETEHRLRSKTGEWIWVLDRGRVVERDAEGRPTRAAGTHLDITRRKKIEERKRMADQKMALHVEQTPLGVIEWDTSFRVTAWNPAAEGIFGYTREEAFGRHASIIVPEGVREHVDHTWRALLSRDGGGRSCNENVTRDGSTIVCEWYNTPLVDSADRVIGVASLVQDITDRVRSENARQQAEARLQHAQKLESLGVLAGGIAHDFNNILTGILGYADLALHDLAADSVAHGNVQEVVNSARHAASLSHQMLAYSGKGKFVIEPIALGDLIRDMASLLEVSVSKKSLLRYSLDDDIPLFDGDVSQVRQIVMNLVVNASEALGERSGVISVTTSAMECDRTFFKESYFHEDQPEGLYVCLDVADTGCGMDKDTLSKVFDPFFTTKFAGRGLGMAAVLGIVRGHGGAIRVYSESGKGSRFRVLFPVSSRATLAGPANEELPPRVTEWRGSGTILVADDEPTVCSLASRMLRRFGFEVLVAEDGLQAVEIFRERHRDIACVLLDLTMPRMDGEEAFQEFRRIDPSVPVVLSSGFNEQDVVQRFTGQGLAGFVQKPYRLENLAAALEKVLG
jgi:two-component system cell cycle sensor histidine kinase/response regulator CckA